MDAAALSPDGRLLVTGLHDGTIQLWDVATGKELRILRGADESKTTTVSEGGSTISTSDEIDSVGFAAFSADGRTVITSDAFATARVWETAAGRELAVLRAKDRLQISFVSVSAASSGVKLGWSLCCLKRGKRAGCLTTSADGTARLWEADSAKELTVLRGHKSYVDWGVFTIDGRSVLTEGDGGVRLWDATTTGEDVTILKGHDGEVRSVAFSPDGQTVWTIEKTYCAKAGRMWARFFVLAVVLDVICQLIVFRWLCPGEALLVASVFRANVLSRELKLLIVTLTCNTYVRIMGL